MEYTHRENSDRTEEKISLLKRIEKRSAKEKLFIIAETIFKCKIWYGILNREREMEKDVGKAPEITYLIYQIRGFQWPHSTTSELQAKV